MAELKHYKLQLISNNGNRVYKVEGYNLTIYESKTLVGDFYQLSTKEVLNLLDHYKLLPKLKTIRILNHMKVGLQGLCSPTLQLLELYATSEMAEGRYGVKGSRKNTLFTLLHEIGHLTGIEEEDKADEFALAEIDKHWGKTIKE